MKNIVTLFGYRKRVLENIQREKTAEPFEATHVFRETRFGQGLLTNAITP